MQPGLIRAVPMAILGFFATVMLVILIRSLQSMDPVWNPELGLIFAGFMSTFFFVWGMGGLDPKLAAHEVPQPPEDVDEESAIVAVYEELEHHHHDDDSHDTPIRILGGHLWTITFWTVVLFLAIFVFALLPGGFSLTVSNEAEANRNAIGYFTLTLGEEELVVSQMAAFIAVTIFTLLSLAAVGWGLAWAFATLSANVKSVKSTEGAPLMLSAGDSAEPALTQGRGGGLAVGQAAKLGLVFLAIYLFMRNTVFGPSFSGQEATLTLAALIFGAALTFGVYRLKLVNFTLAFAVLYVLFYAVLIGLVIPEPPAVRIGLSVVNAAALAVPLVYPVFVSRITGRIAAWLARVLRGLPAFLGQR